MESFVMGALPVGTGGETKKLLMRQSYSGSMYLQDFCTYFPGKRMAFKAQNVTCATCV